ncbi:hypothetical protein SERLA73DRAFT_122533 [Serpula lacrymans var. lacrymans S7.3]|uniref:Uncharacterized protein n=1 Tax=Serpula lacrymans var. lacrymans (strain S7.3) TaxID=936435 RepID=F8PXL7_SERL3|nr:hypothetical protein SERLA73DRAFT_122533 [Serpula lacrymans var. lacrymans S7.3]
MKPIDCYVLILRKNKLLCSQSSTHRKCSSREIGGSRDRMQSDRGGQSDFGHRG